MLVYKVDERTSFCLNEYDSITSSAVMSAMTIFECDDEFDDNSVFQTILDELTSKGYSVSIFEELSDNDAGHGRSTQRKIRALSQIVSPMSPVYLRELFGISIGT